MSQQLPLLHKKLRLALFERILLNAPICKVSEKKNENFEIDHDLVEAAAKLTNKIVDIFCGKNV